jgi:hypothetical protein
MQRLIFESSPAFIILCIAVGIGCMASIPDKKHLSEINQFNLIFYQGTGCRYCRLSIDRSHPQAHHE